MNHWYHTPLESSCGNVDGDPFPKTKQVGFHSTFHVNVFPGVLDMFDITHLSQVLQEEKTQRKRRCFGILSVGSSGCSDVFAVRHTSVVSG